MVEFDAMKTPSQPLSREEWIRLILSMTLFFSLIVRVFPGLLAGFPLNDGGMFLSMIHDLRANGFALPAFTTYNHANIPFAYPPLGFYVGAFLATLGISAVDVLRWLPVTVNFLSIPAFYLLAKTLLKEEPRAVVATALFALVPSSFSWQIMGGGLTRAFGVLFILLALYSAHEMFQRGSWKFVILSILFCSLAVLSHPEVSLATVTGCALFWLFFGRTQRGILQAALVALGTLLLTAPWWGTVIARHGLAPFEDVFHSGAYTSIPLLGLFNELFSFDVWMGLFRLLVIAGIVWSLFRREYFFVAWLAIPYLIEPRSAAAFAFFPECIVAAGLFIDGLPTLIDWIKKKRGLAVPQVEFTQRTGLSLLLFGIMILWFVQNALYDIALVNTSLKPPDPQQAMQWVRDHTPPDSQFLILTGNLGVMTDPIQEWFPAWSDRHSQSTLQGLEWTLGPQFFPRLGQLAELQKCRDVSCVEAWSGKTGLTYTHILLEKSDWMQPMLDSLKADANYSLLFENDQEAVFQLK